MIEQSRRRKNSSNLDSVSKNTEEISSASLLIIFHNQEY